MEQFLAVLLVAGFGYFLYTRIEKRKARRSGGQKPTKPYGSDQER